jgi:hypothetical protein
MAHTSEMNIQRVSCASQSLPGPRTRATANLITLAKFGASFATQDLCGDTLLHTIVRSSVTSPYLHNYERMINKVFKAVGEWAKHCRYKTTIPPS